MGEKFADNYIKNLRSRERFFRDDDQLTMSSAELERLIASAKLDAAQEITELESEMFGKANKSEFKLVHLSTIGEYKRRLEKVFGLS